MIIATAGHVDHGKTSLVKRLTGVDTDRLAEEKRRGLSINLGFAFRQVGQGTRLGFIDVPGHARFINTMIAGVSGIDLALLVVAADDGPMPQTLEHLSILQVLDIDEIVPVLSRIDLVDPEQLKARSAELQALVPNKQHPVFAVSNTSGEGLADLQDYLDEQARAHRPRKPTGNFRLPVDRAFLLKGAGLVLTGTAASGEVALDDTLKLLPQGIELRVRSLRVQDSESDHGQAGQRCALNITGPVKQAQIRRGDVLVADGVSLSVTERFDAQLTLLASAPVALKHLSPVKLYLGSGRYSARAFLINREDKASLRPGQEALVQLILDSPLVCCCGDRFLLRDDSETITLGGGVVLDPQAPRSKKSAPRRLHYLEAMSRKTAGEALRFLLQRDSSSADPAEIDLDAFRQNWNLRQEEYDELLQVLSLKCFSYEGTNYGIDQAAWQRANAHILSLLDAWHSDHPDEQGIRPSLLQKLTQPGATKGLLQAVLSGQLRQGTLKLTHGLLHRAGHKPTLSSGEQRQWKTIDDVLQQSGPKLPLVSELVATTGMAKDTVVQTLDRAVRDGAAHRLNEQRYALPAHLSHYADIALRMAAENEDITVITYKARINSGRKLAIEVLEYFDQLHFTRRKGDSRIIIDSALPGRLFSK